MQLFPDEAYLAAIHTVEKVGAVYLSAVEFVAASVSREGLIDLRPFKKMFALV